MLPLAIPLAISAISALVRYRGKVDTILSLNEATKGLPFKLPDAPINRTEHLNGMIAFFRSERGRVCLGINQLTDSFAAVDNAHKSQPVNYPSNALHECFNLYFEAAEVKPLQIGPGLEADAARRRHVSSGPSEDMRLAYYVVESHRLSRNPTLTRVLLATTDTLLEIAGESAGSFINNPKTKALVESLLTEFAVKHDFDDDSAELILRRLLGSAAIAALDTPNIIPNKPAFAALTGALSDLRKDLGTEFVARLVTKEGFEKFVSGLLGHVATDPSFITQQDTAKKVLTATLTELSKNFPEIVQGDAKAMFGVLEVGIAAGAANVGAVLQKELSGQPLVTVVLTAVATEIATVAQTHGFISKLSTGEVFGDLYRVSLAAVAANPEALVSEANMKPVVAKLISGLADAFATTPFEQTLSIDTMQHLASGCLQILAKEEKFLANSGLFASKVLQAVFASGASAVRDGLEIKDLLIIVQSAVETASGNLALVEMDDHFRASLEAIGKAIAEKKVASLLSLQGQRLALTSAIQAIAANPRIWKGFSEKNIVQPLVVGIINGIASDPTHLLSGSVLVEAMRTCLTATARRGDVILNNTTSPDEITTLLTNALKAADAEIGKTIDGENLPAFLERVILEFLQAPFSLTPANAADFKSLIRKVFAQLGR